MRAQIWHWRTRLWQQQNPCDLAQNPEQFLGFVLTQTFSSFFLWKIFSLYFKFTSRIFNFPLTSLTSSVSRNRFIKEFCLFILSKRIVCYCEKSRKTTNKLNYSEHPLEKRAVAEPCTIIFYVCWVCKCINWFI